MDKKVLFDKFSPNVSEMLETLLTAKYCHMVPDISKFHVPHPIFGLVYFILFSFIFDLDKSLHYFIIN